MEPLAESRRNFLQRSALLAVGLPLLVGCKADILGQRHTGNALLERLRKKGLSVDPSWSGAKDAPDGVSSRTTLAGPSDPGERIAISGTVFQPDGKTAAPNTLIYLYHTDVHGFYGRNGEPRHGRHRGWMLTDTQGRYEFSSIMPASYPDTTVVAHIHMTVTIETAREDSVDSILFEGDRFLTARTRELSGKKGGFQPIVTLVQGADGVGRATRDIQLLKV